jgi:hypothetical protein
MLEEPDDESGEDEENLKRRNIIIEDLIKSTLKSNDKFVSARFD